MSMRWNIANKALEYFRIKRRYDLANAFLLGNKGKVDAVATDLANEYLRLCDKHDNLAHEFITVVDKAARLEAENDFMLRLINEHRIKE